MKRILITSFLLIIITSLFAQKIPFQGKLTENDEPFTGNVDLIFSIDAANWTETHTTVSVLDGYYSVILGSITPLPDSLFDSNDEVQMVINVNGNDLTPVSLYAPYGLKNGKLDSISARDVKLFNDAGSLKAHLNIFETTDAGSLVLNGANDSTKVILGSTGAGYGGYLGLYDSTRNIGAQLRVTNKGLGNLYTYNEAHENVGWFGGIGNDGFMQVLSFDDTQNYSGAVLAGSFVDGTYPELYIEGSAEQNFGLGRFRVTALGNSTEETAYLEINRSNGGGQATLTIVQDDAGADPTGSAAEMFLFGDQSPNIQVGGKGWEDHDLGYLNIFGSIADQSGWFLNSIFIEATSDGAGGESGRIGLNSNLLADSTSVETVNLTGNLFGSRAGGLELRDPAGNSTITLDGGFGAAIFNGDVTVNGQLNVAGGQVFSLDTVETNELRVLDDGGIEKVKLYTDLNAGEFELKAPNDSVNISIGGSGANGPYQGSIYAHDSIGEVKVQIVGRNNGGYLQLDQKDASGNFQSALTFSSNNSNSNMRLFGQNATLDNIQYMIESYVTANQIDLGPVMSGNYRRSGTDWLDNEGNLLAAIGNSRDESGADPLGASGYLSLWGTSSFNAQLTGKRWANNNYPTLQLFGTTGDGGSFYLPNAEVDVMGDGSNKQWAEYRIHTSDSAAQTSVQTLRLTGDFSGLGTGGIELGNITGAVRASVGINDNAGNNYGEIILSNDTSVTQSILLDGWSGNIEVAGTFIQVSDRRLKTNIETQENALEKVRQLRGVNFAWINQNKSQENIGFIAQEVEEVFPEVVYNRSDGYKAVDYASLVSSLVEAIKELDKKVVSLEAENTELKSSLAEKNDPSELEDLRKEVEAIKAIMMSKSAEAGL